MKKIICAALALLLAIGMNTFAFAENDDPVITFKDKYFEDSVRAILDRPCHDKTPIHLSEVQRIKSLDFSRRLDYPIDWNDRSYSTFVRDLDDLKYFTSLEQLKAGHRGGVDCTKIDLSGCPDLKYLDVSNSYVGNVDVTHNPKLEYLNISCAQIQTIDVTHNPYLKYLNCSSNHVETVDLSNNPQLEYLDLSCNRILLPPDNPFIPYIEQCTLKSLDVTHNPALKELYLRVSDVTEIDFTSNKNLEVLDITNTPIDSIDLSNCAKLTALHISNTGVKELDVSQNTELTTLSCGNNKIEKLDLSKNTKLSGRISLGGNGTKEYIIGFHPDVTELYIAKDNITSLDVKGLPNLETLYCWDCKLTGIDLSANTHLKYLELENNNIRSVDLSANKLLEVLGMSKNKLTSIDLSSNRELRYINLCDNKLTSLDLTSNTALETVRVRFNYFNSEADVEGWSDWSYVNDWQGNAFEPQRTQEGFEDVNPDDWYYRIVNEARERELVAGFEDGTFSPKSSITRAQFAVMLANYEGVETYGEEVRFDDVNVKKWYTGAIDWADKNGIMIGVTENWFAPHRPITREQLMTALYRYAEYKGYTFDKVYTDLFEDDTAISKWAHDCVMAMKAEGIVVGKGNNTFAPKDDTTRAEATQIFVNFVNMLEG